MNTKVMAVKPELPIPGRLPPANGTTMVAAVTLGLVAIGPLLLGDFASFVGARIAVTAIVGLSIVVVTGYTGQLSLMPYTFVGLGVFVAAHAITSWDWPFWFAAMLAAGLSLPLSLLVGLVSVRLRGFYFAIATLTFASAMGATLFAWDSFTGGQKGLQVDRPVIGPIDLTGDRAFYLLCLVTVLALVWMVMGLRESRIGRAMTSVRENEIAAATMGINVMKTKLVAFVVSGMIATVGGVFQGMLLQQVTRTPYQTPFVETLGVTLVILVVVGGMRSAWGPFIGATLIYVQLEVFRTALFLQYFIAAITAAAFIFVLLKLPGGVVGLIKHEAAQVRAAPVKNGIRVALIILLNVAVFYLIWEFSQ